VIIMNENMEILISKVLGGHAKNKYTKIEVIKHLGEHDMHRLLETEILLSDKDVKVKMAILDQFRNHPDIIQIKNILAEIIVSKNEDETIKKEALIIFQNNYGKDVILGHKKLELDE